MNEDHGKRFADKSTRAVRETCTAAAQRQRSRHEAPSEAISRLLKAFAILTSD